MKGLYAIRLGGLVKLKKIREKTRIRQKPNPPTLLSISLFFFETFGNMKTTQKTHNFPQKIIIWVGLDPPIHFQVFLVFLDFFQLDKTP